MDLTNRGADRATGADSGRGATRRTSRIEVEIGELVLDGFERVDGDRVAEAFRRELSRLVREYGVPLADDLGGGGGRGAAGADRGHSGDEQGTGTPELTLDLLAGLPPLPYTVSSARLGTELARSVHAGLTTGRGRRPEQGRA